MLFSKRFLNWSPTNSILPRKVLSIGKLDNQLPNRRICLNLPQFLHMFRKENIRRFLVQILRLYNLESYFDIGNCNFERFLQFRFQTMYQHYIVLICCTIVPKIKKEHTIKKISLFIPFTITYYYQMYIQ